MIKFLLQNLDQALTSKSQPNISISSQTNCREISDGVSESVSDKGSQCRQLYQLFFQRRKSFSPYKSCLNFNFKVLTKPCAQSLNKSLALWPNLSSQICNKLLPTRSSSSTFTTVTTSTSFELPSSHTRVTSIKFAKRQLVSESVSELVTRVNNDRTRVR